MAQKMTTYDYKQLAFRAAQKYWKYKCHRFGGKLCNEAKELLLDTLCCDNLNSLTPYQMRQAIKYLDLQIQTDSSFRKE